VKTKVFLALPSTGQREDYHTYIIEHWRKRYEDEIEFVLPERCENYFGHDFARNMYAERFLESDCDVMCFLDSDVIPPEHLFDLITVHGNKGWLAAGAPYPLWLARPGTKDMAVCYSAYAGNAPDEKGNHGFTMAAVPQQGIEWVDGLATGCLLLRRELFAKLEKPYFQFKRNPETCEVIEGEDLGFALKLQKLGIKYFCDHGMVCGHYKRINLLEVQNYATQMSNEKVVAFHAQVKDAFEQAVQRAAGEGYRKGLEAGRAEAHIPRKTQSGLILPASL
jgi:hypothetical protein